MGHGRHMNACCQLYKWVMSHLWMIHVSHMNEMYERGWSGGHHPLRPVIVLCLRHPRKKDRKEMNESCLTYEWAISHVWALSLIWTSHVTYEWVMSHMNAPRHTHTNTVTHREKAVARGHVWIGHVSHMDKSCHIWMCYVTHMNTSCHTKEWELLHIWMCHVSLMNESCHSWMRHVTHTHTQTHIGRKLRRRDTATRS